MSRRGPTRSGLVDVVRPEAFPHDKARLYPFLLGALPLWGAEGRWLVVPRGGEAPFLTFDLDPEARRWLLDHVEGGLTHLILSEPPSERLRAWLVDHCLRRGCTTLWFSRPGPLEHGKGWWFQRWLEAPEGPSESLPEVAEPRYEATSFCRWQRWPTALVTGALCSHGKPISAHPRYAHLDLRRCESTRGCSFCSAADMARAGYSMAEPELALRQIRAVQEARNPPRDPRTFTLSSPWIFAHMDRFFASLEEAKTLASSFLFSCRADDIVRHRRAAERAIPLAQARGDRVGVASVGAESFSSAENSRFAKGLEPETVLVALDILRSWERRWPETFSFGAHGGLGIILFTPWTTVADLRDYLAVAKAQDLGHTRFALTRRLALLPGLPITELARDDGLLGCRSAHDEARFALLRDRCDPGCRHWPEETDLPWRFAHDEVAALCGVAVRLALREDPPWDGLHAELRARCGEANDRELLDLFGLLVDIVAQDSTVTTEGALARELLRRLPQEAAPSTSASPWERGLRALSRHKSDPLDGFRLISMRGGPKELPCEMTFASNEGQLVVFVAEEGTAGRWDHQAHGLCFVLRDEDMCTSQRRRGAKLLAAVVAVCGR